jgi:hypothetical protein
LKIYATLKQEVPKAIFRRPDDKYAVKEEDFSKNAKILPNF